MKFEYVNGKLVVRGNAWTIRGSNVESVVEALLDADDWEDEQKEEV